MLNVNNVVLEPNMQKKNQTHNKHLHR